MAAPSTAPPLFLRISVVVGLGTLLIGLLGAVAIVLHRPVVAAMDPHPEPIPASFASGQVPLEGLEVFARWSGADGEDVEELGVADLAGGGWHFPTAPRGRPLAVGVRDLRDGAARELLRRMVVLPPDGGPIVLPP